MKELSGKLMVSFVVALGLLFYAGLAQAITWDVCPSGCSYSSIQDAIDVAVDGVDDVLVDDGTYVENINFKGKAITIKSVNGPEVTIIDGNASGSVVTFWSGEGASSVLDGFTITNGFRTPGGGILCLNSSSPTITNCIITGNSAIGGSGGGVLCSGGAPTITNCIISKNKATYGGGINCSHSTTAQITNCTISGNTADDGGGIRCAINASPTVTNSILWGNSSGEIYLHGTCSINITYSDIQGGYPGIGNIDADPVFDVDYYLSAGSPCIDRGTDDAVAYPTLPIDDIDGDFRPYDVTSIPNNPSGYDMGADEYVSPIVEVKIDIKPDSDTNSINLSSAGVIPVAILSSETFDATTIDPGTVSLAGAKVRVVGKSEKYLSHEEDVNGDGLLDLVCKVYTAQFMVEPGETIAVLEAETFDGIPVRGEDSLNIVPDGE